MMISGTGNSREHREGFTIVEVLIATVVLAVGLGSVLTAYSLTVSALDAATDTLVEAQILSEQAAALDLSIGPDRPELRPGVRTVRVDVPGYAASIACLPLRSETGLDGTEAVLDVWRNRQSEHRGLVTQWVTLPRQSELPLGPLL